MRFSDISVTDLNKKERIDKFSTPYNDFGYFGIDVSKKWGPITMYAQYLYKDGKTTHEPTQDQIIVTRDDDISFIIAEDD